MKVVHSGNFKQNIRRNFCVFAKFFLNTNETEQYRYHQKKINNLIHGLLNR